MSRQTKYPLNENQMPGFCYWLRSDSLMALSTVAARHHAAGWGG